MTMKRIGATPWGRQPHGKQLDKLFNALLGLVRKDSTNLLRGVAEELAEDVDCDKLYWTDYDEDGPSGGSMNPDIPTEEIFEKHEGDWIWNFRKDDRKFDKIVTQFLDLHEDDEDEALSWLEEEFTEVLFGRVLEDFDGEELDDTYDEMRGECWESEEEARDPYGYRGLSRSDFYASRRAVATLTWRRDVEPALEAAGHNAGNDRSWAPWAKDMDRAENIASRAYGDPAKMLRLSENMAKSIKNLQKAVRRGRAVEEYIGSEYASPFYQKALELLGKQASLKVAHRWMLAKDHDIPKEVEEKAKEVEKGNPGYDDAKVWATAWSIYCKHIEPGSDHCSKKPGEYLKKKAAADDSWTGMVEVEALTDEDELDDEDADMLRDAPYGPYTVSARNKRDAEEAILDAFANDVPVSLPEDFDIEVKRLKKASRTAGGEVTIADVERFVKRQRTYMEVDRKDRRSLHLITREDGDMENDEPGEGDLDEARRVGRAVAKEFGRDIVSVEMDYMDEWVTLGITLKDLKKKAGSADKAQLKVLKDTVRNPDKGKFLGGPTAEEAEKTLRKKFRFTDRQIAQLKKAAGADRELLKDWAEHVQKNRRRWEGRKYDADDWYDEALEFAGSSWKFHNLDPWDDIPMREVERYAEDNAPDMLTHVDAPSAARVARRHLS